jgi:eukaryotic-like serine/threonine-protein kinase
MTSDAIRLGAALSDRYRIEREIGAGGMATVYLAEDLRHRRRVALKLLRPELGAVLGPERFLSEINVTANLQHPHLLPLFDSGEADGLLFYVMPYVEGESLRARLERERQLPVEEAVRMAVAVAGALDYAHRHGVIHRDLKPENILLHDGQPLVADFGIALAVSNAGGQRVTQTGLSLGTPQYMSPEQATGDRVIDARSDIYSLGAVLYEMLTGEPPHSGTTSQAVIARLLTEKPRSVRATRASVPAHVEAALEQALEKLPADRFASASEFAEALTGARAVVPAGRGTAAAADEVVLFRVPARVRLRVRAALPWGIAAAALTFAGAGALFPPAPVDDGWPTVFPVTFSEAVEPLTPAGVTLAITRDGSRIAFDAQLGSQAGIFTRRLDELGAQFVRGTEGGSGPSFSPDGSWILFNSADGAMHKVPTEGGSRITLSATMPAQRYTMWGDGDVLVGGYGDLYRLSATGGEAELLARPDTTRGHLRYGWAHPLPGGRAAVITIWKGGVALEHAQLAVMRLDDGAITELGIAGTGPRFVDGHLLFGRSDGTIFSAPFSLRRLRTTAAPVPVLHDVLVKAGGAVELAASRSGTLIYKQSAALSPRSLVRVDKAGVEEPLGVDSLVVEMPRVSPDGRRIAMNILRGNSASVWVKDLRTGALMRLTQDGYQRPEWMPDGRRIAYLSSEWKVLLQPWDGSNPGVVYINATTGVADLVIGGAGLLAYRSALGRPGITVAPQDSPAAVLQVLTLTTQSGTPAISPDGTLLAYADSETGRREVYVRPLTGPGSRVQLSTRGGTDPRWSPDGREVFYRGTSHLIAATIVRSPELDVLRQDTLFPDPYARGIQRAEYDVFPDGRHFVFVRGGERREADRMMAITNWSPAARSASRPREQER